jgi:hypothetical protein
MTALQCLRHVVQRLYLVGFKHSLLCVQHQSMLLWSVQEGSQVLLALLLHGLGDQDVIQADEGLLKAL